MSLKNLTKPEKNVVEFEFTIDAEAFKKAVSDAYKKNVGKMNVPGFRKGKAPRAIIEKMYGKGVFYDEALNACIPDAYEAAYAEAAVEGVSRPEFDVVSLEDGEDVVMKAKIFVKPEVEISDYAGIEAERSVKPVTDDEVNADIERKRNQNSRMIDVTDRAAADGDTVNINYEGSVDGIPFDGGKADGHELKLGSGQFIPGFEGQIVGHNTGDEFDVNVTFPEDYHAEELKGKPAVFNVKLNGIKFTELPALDDEFAKDVSEFDTLADYTADVRKKLEEKNAKDADAAVEEKLIDALLGKLEADIPEAMFENETENLLRDYDNRLRMQGLDLSTYFKYTGLDLDSMRKQFRPQAERQVKTRLALEKIAAKEALEVTESDIEDEFKRIAEAYQMELDKVKEALPAESVTEDMRVKKAIEFVKNSAKITEVPYKAEDNADNK